MLSAGKKERDFRRLVADARSGNNTTRKDPGSAVFFRSFEVQDFSGRIVGVENFALGRLTYQLFLNRLQLLGGLVEEFPLSRLRQGDSEFPL